MEFEQLMQRMSGPCREIFEQSVATASSRSHHTLEVEHWLREAVQQQDRETEAVLTQFELDRSRLLGDLEAAVEALRTGNDGFPRISSEVARLLFEAWMIASSEFGLTVIRPIHLLLALTENEVLRPRLTQISPELSRLAGDALREACTELLAGSEETETRTAGSSKDGQQALDQFTIDLTAQARAGGIERVLGRDDEVRQMVDILCRRRQNNPILTGEAGVGKTAVVEGLARRIADGDVPERLRDVSLRVLDIGLLQAGAGVKGEFENRLKNVIHEVQTATKPVILFVDEAHTLIGAGNQAGSGDAANLLKPALARGELRTIAATTWAEYKKYFESDAALSRRFQVVHIDEPSEDDAIIMLRGTVDSLEDHHDVAVLEEAVEAAVRLSNRYITGRQLPDKCVSLLDTACARVALSQTTTPRVLEAEQQAYNNAQAELRRLKREREIGHQHDEAITELEARCEQLNASLEELRASWRAVRDEVEHAVDLRKRIEAAETEVTADGSEGVGELQDQLAAARARRAALEPDTHPMLYECVDANVVAQVVADWTGIPVGRMHTDEIQSVLNLRDQLGARVIGQPHALELIARHMRTARAKLGDPKRPLGVFLLVGPSGVGKTETALALAEQLYGSEQAMTTINMSEFKEEHKVSLLMGSPPGYVGYGEGGVLTEAVRRKPYSVVLLDEIEKAHPGVQDIFYQIFDKGVLRDGEGRDIDFRNTVILMTSNTAAPEIERLCADPDTRPTPAGLDGAIAESLRETFKPAFLGRLQVIPYYPLDDSALGEVVRLQMSAVQDRIHSNYRVPLRYSDALIQQIVEACNESDTGARQISAVLSNQLLPAVAERVLGELARGTDIGGIHIDQDPEASGFAVQVTLTEDTQTTDAPPRAITGTG